MLLLCTSRSDLHFGMCLFVKDVCCKTETNLRLMIRWETNDCKILSLTTLKKKKKAFENSMLVGGGGEMENAGNTLFSQSPELNDYFNDYHIFSLFFLTFHVID